MSVGETHGAELDCGAGCDVITVRVTESELGTGGTGNDTLVGGCDVRRLTGGRGSSQAERISPKFCASGH